MRQLRTFTPLQVLESGGAGFDRTRRGGLELSVVIPADVFRLVEAQDYSTSIQIVKGLLDGAFRAAPISIRRRRWA